VTLLLKNPHSVLAALDTRPADVLQIQMPSSYFLGDTRGGVASAEVDAWARVAGLARTKGVKLVQRSLAGANEARQSSDKSRSDGRVGIAEALVREREPVSLEQLFSGARERAGGCGLWLALDSLQDPHNLGAIFRTAAFFGVQGILVTQERSAPVSSTVYDVASGGLEYVPFAIQVNLQRAFEVAKEVGLWILGTSEHANDDVSSIQRDRPWLLVLGNEERGMRRLTEEACDVLCRVSPKGKVSSLNVSVAAGVFISQLA
jgi:23S rRNA (guanosine2251-2'-O)-methyltransferase